MTSDFQSDNLTKYLASTAGYGENKIQDGYIKTVEKIWMDSYTINFTSTKTTIDIAVLPNGSKLIDVIVIIESSVGAITHTGGTIALGFSEDLSFGSLYGPLSVTHNATETTISLLAIGAGAPNSNFANRISSKFFQKIIQGTQNTICLQLNNWTMTTGTVKSIVRYT